jgi:hypothetical protein
MEKWIVSRSRANIKATATPGVWHIQARTEDQLSSFVCIATDNVNLLRGKTWDGKKDVFTLSDTYTGATMNVVGQIEYTGDWKGIPKRGA